MADLYGHHSIVRPSKVQKTCLSSLLIFKYSFLLNHRTCNGRSCSSTPIQLQTMASLGLTPEELKAVEQTRQRLSQLSSSINSLKNDVFVSNPLPSMCAVSSS